MRAWALTLLRHGVAWWPLAALLFDAWLGRLSPNPIQDWTQRTGRAALTMLAFSLSATPLAWWRPLRWLKPWRRTWGLYAFAYAVLHVYLFVGVDYGWRWDWLWDEVLRQKPYIWLGAAAWLILAALAATSPRRVARRLGARRWKALHRAVYVAAGVAWGHQALAAKGNAFALQGDVGRVWRYGIVIAALLAARVGRWGWRAWFTRKLVVQK